MFYDLLMVNPPRICKASLVEGNPSSPLSASFWLTEREKIYILIVCTIFLIGLAARYFFLKNEILEVYTPAGIEKTEQNHE